MAKYEATPGSTISGGYIIGSVEALGVYKPTGYQILADCGLKDPKSEQMYPMQVFCDFFEAISNKIGQSTILMMGRNVGSDFHMPAGMDDMPKFFASLDGNLKAGTKGLRADEGWKTTLTGPKNAELVFTGILPDNFVRGLIEGMGTQVLKGGKVNAHIDETKPSVDRGGHSTTLQCAW